MTVRPILTAPDPHLKAISAEVGKVDAEIRKLAEDMADSMYAADGIGLAAVQVGVPKRVLVMDLARDEAPRAPRYFVNPEIVWASEDTVPYEEGCLSVPEVYDEVERSAKVRLTYLDYSGEAIEEEAEGLFAVCIQHEIDHLNGVLFIDHLSRLKRQRAVARVRKAAKAEELEPSRI